MRVDAFKRLVDALVQSGVDYCAFHRGPWGFIVGAHQCRAVGEHLTAANQPTYR